MLADLESVERLLICPRSGRPLVRDGETFRSEGGPCYPTIAGTPVLVDFERSILKERTLRARRLSSTLPRAESRARRWVKDRLLRPAARGSAAQQALRFVRLLKQRSPRPLVLVVGGGSAGIGTDLLYGDPDVRVVGLDVYDSPLVHFVADAHHVPLRSASVDGVWIQYVLEHVLDPWRVVAEIHRVLGPDGLVYAETPFLQHVHEAAYDFVRFTHSGHRWLFRHFSEIDSGVGMGSGVQLLWTLEAAAAGLFRSRSVGKLAKLLLFWVQFVERLVPARSQLDAASSLYFVGRRAETPIGPSEMVEYYEASRGRRARPASEEAPEPSWDRAPASGVDGADVTLAWRSER